MLDFLLIVAVVLVFIAIPVLRSGARRDRQAARDDTSFPSPESAGTTWSFSDPPSSSSDSGSCSAGDSGGCSDSSSSDCSSSD